MFFSLPQHVKLKNEVIPSSHFEVKLNAAYEEGVSLFSLELQFTIQATGGSKTPFSFNHQSQLSALNVQHDIEYVICNRSGVFIFVPGMLENQHPSKEVKVISVI